MSPLFLWSRWQPGLQQLHISSKHQDGKEKKKKGPGGTPTDSFRAAAWPPPLHSICHVLVIRSYLPAKAIGKWVRSELLRACLTFCDWGRRGKLFFLLLCLGKWLCWIHRAAMGGTFWGWTGWDRRRDLWGTDATAPQPSGFGSSDWMLPPGGQITLPCGCPPLFPAWIVQVLCSQVTFSLLLRSSWGTRPLF